MWKVAYTKSVETKGILGYCSFQDDVESVQCIPMCFSIGTLKTINFPFVPNGKLMFLVSQWIYLELWSSV